MNGPESLRMFLLFFIGPWLIAAAAVACVLVGTAIWSDCLHDSPGHVCGDALLFVLIAPFYSIGFAMSVWFMPMVVGALLAVLGGAIFGRVPAWYAMAVLPVCALAYVAQGAPWFAADAERALWARVLIVAGVQAVAVLLICWRLAQEDGAFRRVIEKLDRAAGVTAVEPEK
jgi:hypothetical protein